MMKKYFFTSILTFSTILSCNAITNMTMISKAAPDYKISQTTKVEHTIVGNVKYHTLKTKFLHSGTRDVIVYLPPSYDKNTNLKYPVLYMHDGQNIFDKATGAFGKEWYVDEKLECLIQKKVIKEVIIVGPYNGLQDRILEYTWNPMPGEGGGEGKSYGDFLTQELKPFIDKTYRTKADRENTAVLGSSLGGLISLYIARNYSDVFSKIGMMSPSLWWNNGEAIKEVDSMTDKFDFWIDGGTKESETMVSYVEQLHEKLRAKYGDDHIFEYIQPEANHSEEAWATRVHGPLIQFFGVEKDPNKKRELINKLMTYEEWANL